MNKKIAVVIIVVIAAVAGCFGTIAAIIKNIGKSIDDTFETGEDQDFDIIVENQFKILENQNENFRGER